MEHMGQLRSYFRYSLSSKLIFFSSFLYLFASVPPIPRLPTSQSHRFYRYICVYTGELTGISNQGFRRFCQLCSIHDHLLTNKDIGITIQPLLLLLLLLQCCCKLFLICCKDIIFVCANKSRGLLQSDEQGETSAIQVRKQHVVVLCVGGSMDSGCIQAKIWPYSINFCAKLQMPLFLSLCVLQRSMICAEQSCNLGACTNGVRQEAVRGSTKLILTIYPLQHSCKLLILLFLPSLTQNFSCQTKQGHNAKDDIL